MADQLIINLLHLMNAHRHQTAANPQTKHLSCEFAGRMLLSTFTITIYYYCSPQRLIYHFTKSLKLSQAGLLQPNYDLCCFYCPHSMTKIVPFSATYSINEQVNRLHLRLSWSLQARACGLCSDYKWQQQCWFQHNSPRRPNGQTFPLRFPMPSLRQLR